MKTKVGVLFGGMSVEHEVSVISGLQALHSLNSDKYEPVPIYISKKKETGTPASFFPISSSTKTFPRFFPNPKGSSCPPTSPASIFFLIRSPACSKAAW